MRMIIISVFSSSSRSDEKFSLCKTCSRDTHFAVEMANFSSITGVGFPSPVSAASKSGLPAIHYQPLSSHFSYVSQFPAPYFEQSQNVPSPTVVSSPNTSICLSTSVMGDLTMSQRDHNPRPSTTNPPGESMTSNLAFSDFTTQWQHSIPSRMPWVNGKNNDSTQFSGMAPAAEVNNSENGYSTPGFSPLRVMRASRRHKRKSNGYSSEGPPDKIIINEDRMAEKMGDLQLQGSNSGFLNGGQKSKPVPSPTDEDDDECWFSVVEDDGMNAEADEETGEQVYGTVGQRSQEGSRPQLQLSKELVKSLKKTDPMSKLIQNELNKSKMQVVLWQPPGGQVADLMSMVMQGHTKDTPTQPSQGDRIEGSEVRCEGDGMAEDQQCIGRGEADGTATTPQATFCGFNNAMNIPTKLSHDFTQNILKPSAIDNRVADHCISSDLGAESHRMKQNPVRLPSLNLAGISDSGNGFTHALQRGQMAANGAFSFGRSTNMLNGQTFSFVEESSNVGMDFFGVRPLGGEFQSADLSACSTPKESAMCNPLQSTKLNSSTSSQSNNRMVDASDLFDDDMDL